MKHRLLDLVICLITGAIIIMSSEIIFTKGSAPAIPDTGKTAVYVKNDDIVYQMDDQGVERPLGLGDSTVTEDDLATSVAGNGLSGGGGNPLDVNVDNSTIEISSDTLRVKDGGITADKIANRTRKLWVPITRMYNASSGAQSSDLPAAAGFFLDDGADMAAGGTFRVPDDWVSGNTLYVYGAGSASGDAYLYVIADYSAIGEVTSTHSVDQGPTATAVTTTRSALMTLTLTSLAAGDIVFVSFTRYSTDPLDTLNGGALIVDGFVLEYTADS